MWKRHSIAAKKAAWDQAKARNYSKIGKIIQMAAKLWAEPSMNPSLELALQKAKYYNLPREVIDKAIKKWSGQLKWEDLKEVMYEWYGPGGVAVLVKTLTDNTNRTSSSIRIVFSKFWWSLWEPWSVSWQFIQRWVFVIDWKIEIVNDKGNKIEKIIPLNIEESEEELLDLDFQDLEIEDWKIILIVEKNNFINIRDELKNKAYNVVDSAIHYIPDNTISLNDEDVQQLDILLENLEEDEDVDYVYSNIKQDI